MPLPTTLMYVFLRRPDLVIFFVLTGVFRMFLVFCSRPTTVLLPLLMVALVLRRLIGPTFILRYYEGTLA